MLYEILCERASVTKGGIHTPLWPIPLAKDIMTPGEGTGVQIQGLVRESDCKVSDKRQSCYINHDYHG